MTFLSGVTFEIRPGRIDDLLDLTFEDASFVYDGTEKSIEVAVDGVLPIGFSIQYQNHTRTEAGYQDVQAVISGPSYEPLELTARLTIEKATPALSATWDGSMIDADALFELTYGDLASILTSHTNTDQNVSVDVLLMSGDGVADMSDLLALRAIVAGTARIALMLPESANYKEVQLAFRVQVHPKLITVIAEPKTKVFAELDPVFTYSFSPALVAGDEFDGALSREAEEDVGAYPIELGTLDLGPNYELVLQSADLIITPADIRNLDGFDLDFADATFVFTGQPHAVQISGTLPAGASVSYADNIRTDADSQIATALITMENHHPLELQAILHVSPGTRTIAFPEWTQKTFGDSDFDPQAKSSSGETIQYSSSDEQVAIITESGQIHILGAGTTTITASVPENSNYENKPVERRTLVVAKAKQVISLSGPSEVNRNVGTIALEVHSSSALPVDLTVDDPLIATLEGDQLRIHRLGTLRITATQPGNENYEAAEPVSLTIRVLENDAENPADSDKIKGIRVHQAVSPNGDGINDFLIIEGIRDYPENRLTIFNRNGMVVYEAHGYDNGSIVFRGQGRNQQLLPAGTYYYLLDVKIDSVWKQEKGFIVLRY